MPQPLRRVKKDATYFTGPEAPVMRPDLAPLVAAVISHWSFIERDLGVTIGRVMHVEVAGAALSMFYALGSTRTRIDALNGAVEVTLEPNVIVLYERVMKEVRACARERNAIAHGLWGWSDDLPDALLLVEQYTEAHLFGASLRARLPDKAKAPVMVYRKPDFEGIISRMTRVRGLLSQFQWIPRLKHDDPWRAVHIERLAVLLQT